MIPGFRPTLRWKLVACIAGAAVAMGAVCLSLAGVRPWYVVAVVAAVSVVTGAGYFVVGRLLRPLADVTNTARRVSAQNMDERVRLQGRNDEVKELADALDDTLDRLSESLASTRRFVSNASHELRTPLTVMRTEIDVALSNPDEDVDELRHMARVVHEGCVRANELIESLLWLTQAESGAAHMLPEKVLTDLGECLDSAVSAVESVADELNLSLAKSRLPAPVLGAPRLLERLVANLVENAIRHNVPEGRIWMLTGGDAHVSWVVVGNTGAAVELETLSMLFEPFNRGNKARVGRDGAGLGMSIVRAVAHAHDGEVFARALPDGGGMEVRVEIPAAKQ